MKAGDDPYNGEAYRRSRSNILATFRGKYEGLRTGAGLAELTPRTVDQKILAGFFDEAIAPASQPDGSVDFELQEELERAYRKKVFAQYGEAGVEALDRDLGASGNWLDEQFRTDQQMLEPYWNWLDGAWDPVILDGLGLSIGKSFPSFASFQHAFLSDMTRTLTGTTTPAALRERFPGGTLTQRQAQQLAIDIFAKTTKDYSDFRSDWRNEYLKENPDQLNALERWTYPPFPNLPKELEPYLQ